MRQLADQRFAVFRAFLAVLFKLDNALPHLPIGFDELGVHRLYGTHLALLVIMGNLPKQLLVLGTFTQILQFHNAPIFFRCSSTRAASVATSSTSSGNGVA